MVYKWIESDEMQILIWIIEYQS